ncbi:MAG TPA: hypothetical protein PKZ76_14140 [Xanthomonadaceae bacterium]|nr:hypothetical protein [Xanthomonadaceae bacterium]
MNITPDRVLTAYAAVARELDLPDLEAAQLAIEREDLSSPEALAAWLDRMSPRSGWMVCQSSHWLMLGPDERPDADAGTWIEGEFQCEDGSAASFSHLGGGCWRALRFVEGEGEDCLVGRFMVRGTRGAPGRLLYRRYWNMEGGAPRVRACTFRGFEEARK